MRRMIAYLTVFILVLSCMAEPGQGGTAVDASLEGAPVTVTFSVPDISLLPATKTWDTGDGDITGTPYLDPNKVYLVVCGGTQSIKYIRKAELVKEEKNYVIPPESYPLSEGDRHTTLYTFQVQLELSDEGRTIHILGNVDENQLIAGAYSYENLPGLLSYVNKQAYWQKLYVPFIKAKKDPVTQEPEIKDGSYVPNEATQGFFRYIPLIRNFAKIQVTNEAKNFELHSYAVIYYPERGSVVPYRSNEPDESKRFDFNLNPPSGYHLSGYESSTFDELQDNLNYPGNMPTGVVLNNVVPSASEFVNPNTSHGRVLEYKENDAESGFYIYERGIPTDQIDPTFIIICGKFEEDDNWYYYRLDLMETRVEGTQTVTTYYPIFRNFRYNIQVHRISSEGVLSPELAVVSSGADDISADVSMRHLSDISDGKTRLVVEPFMTRTYTGPAKKGEYYELYARFFRDVYSDSPSLEIRDVWVELEPMTDDSENILILYNDNGNPVSRYFFPEPVTVGDVEGIRIIRFNTVAPQSETKTQKIKITGRNADELQGGQRLYREVEITLQKKQPLTVSCPNTVEGATNIPVDVSISIPAELPESMFPLEFIVEPEDLTLTPDITKNTENNINMPVRSGKSIATTESPDKDTPAFYYLRTLTWDEYSNLTVENGQRTFHCYFKTNRDYNATTIWVYNEYFDNDHAYASFENTELSLTLNCTNPVLILENTPITLDITIPSNLPESYFPLTFIIEPENRPESENVPDNMTIKSDKLSFVNGLSIATDQTDTYANHFIKTLEWSDYTSLPITAKGRTFSCNFKSSVGPSATTIWVDNERGLFKKAKVSFRNKKLTMTLTCTDPVLEEIGTSITLNITVPSNIPKSYFPLTFTIEPEKKTITSVDLEGVPEPYYFERKLEWGEYSNNRTFSCNFKSVVEQSATNIWVSNQLFDNAKVFFRNTGELTDHFWVEAIGDKDCTVKLNYAELQFKRSTDADWQDYSQNSDISLPAGKRVSFKSKSTQTRTIDNAFNCTGGKFNVGGNFASLMVGDNYPFDGATKKGDKFINFFKGHENLIDASDLVLPMTSLSENAYQSMFDSCPNLVAGPKELPATTLARFCYRFMFQGCAALTAAPELPATTLADNCYQSMFINCISLKNAPELRAATLVKYCYYQMFKGCTSLTTAPELPATTLASNCYQSMFQDCTSLTAAPALPATALATYCYDSMFQGCTSLTTAPVLASETLVAGCYNHMFYGCSSLRSVICMATKGINSNSSTADWLNGVPNTAEDHGEFVYKDSANWPSNYNGIPTYWVKHAGIYPVFPKPFDPEETF